MRTIRSVLALALSLAAAFVLAAAAGAQIRPSAEVLVPYFAIDLANPQEGDATLFAVCNHGPEASEVVFTVFSNWGVPVLETRRTMQGDEVVSVNLRDWIVYGALLERSLTVEEILHVKAALSGKASPKDNRYYGTEIEPDLAVGYVTVRTIGAGRRPSLWGDFFTVRPLDEIFQGDTLVNIDRGQDCPEGGCVSCKELGLRFLEPEGLDTHLVIWSEKHGIASNEPTLPDWARLRVVIEVYDEAGDVVDERAFSLLPVQALKLSDFLDPLPVDFGWLEIELSVDGFVVVDFNYVGSAVERLHAYCLPPEATAPGAKIRLKKHVNELDADQAPGLILDAGSPLVWTYEVRNVGSEPLWGVYVDDPGQEVTCPADTLEPGESFVCTSSGTALGCQRSNTATAWGMADTGPVEDSDQAFYYGQYHPALTISDIAVNGLPAGEAPGPGFTSGAALTWAFKLTNTGDAHLTGVHIVTDFPMTCAATALAPGESTTCTGGETAGAGNIVHLLRAHGVAPCDSVETEATANAYVLGELPAGLTIEKLTNGEHVTSSPGPHIKAGTAVTWTYVVTNGSQVTLTNVTVTDDRGPVVSCPKTTLQSGESMTCTASGTATTGQYSNTGTAVGTPPAGPNVTASDPSWYFGVAPAIAVEKLVDGHEADTPPGPSVETGSSILWTYVVVNVGDYALTGIQLIDDQGILVTCPKTVLAPAESMTCTAHSVAESGAHTNVATAVGHWNGDEIQATDPAHYVGERGLIRIEKRTNGEDADTPPGPSILEGSPVQWTYVVTNTGDVPLTSIAVSDSEGSDVSCPKTVLEPGETMTCTASGTATKGQYMNIGTVSGTPPSGPVVTASDPSHYFGAAAKIGVQKLVNGEDADFPPGPTFMVGTPLVWTYVVTNLGDVVLFNITVTDNQGITVTCPKDRLRPAQSMTCTADGIAVAGQYSNVGTATANTTADPGPPTVSASDPCHYYGQVLGNQGCTPGYWKNHTDSWPPTGYSTGQDVDTVFPNVNTYYPGLGNDSLLWALGYAGGPGGQGAAEILLRAGVAALLNASHPGVAYPSTTASVIADVNNALLQNRDAMLTLAAALDADNNLGCPLN